MEDEHNGGGPQDVGTELELSAWSDDAEPVEVLSGDDKWWEFLDPQTMSLPDQPTAARAHDHLLDWSKIDDSVRPRALMQVPGIPCRQCTNQVPSDLACCVHCGAPASPPAYPSRHAILVKRLRNDRALVIARELFLSISPALAEDEVEKMFDELPVLFVVHATQGQVSAWTNNLANRGIYTRAFRERDPTVPWIREVWESLMRGERTRPALWITAVFVVLLGFWSIPASVGLLVLASVYLERYVRWFRTRYEIDPNRLLSASAGVDPSKLEIAAGLLREMKRGQIRSTLSQFLMEYYTLKQLLLSDPVIEGGMSKSLDEILERVFDQVNETSERHVALYAHLQQNPVEAVRNRVLTLEERLAGAENGEERSALADRLQRTQLDLQHAETLSDLLERLEARMNAVVLRMTNTRLRLQSLPAKMASAAATETYDAMAEEWELEFSIAEEVRKEVAAWHQS